ncbi:MULTISPECIES: GNAT family N-acetyltransferase [Kribbella]|nr:MULTISPECIES: GNAT family N-acetyltransferase [Kribbella]
MTAAGQLIPGRPAPAPLVLEEVGPDSAELIRAVYVRIWEPLGSGGRSIWTNERWADELSQPAVHTWVARVEGAVAGLVELELAANGNVGIVIFGLLPEFQSKGFGGLFLTLATETAWNLSSPSGKPTTRVWLQTSSADHPHALTNYKHRGFRIIETTPLP